MKPPASLTTALVDATFQAYREEVIRLPLDVLKVIGNAARAETNPVARGEFANILKKIKTAGELGVPAGTVPRRSQDRLRVLHISINRGQHRSSAQIMVKALFEPRHPPLEPLIEHLVDIPVPLPGRDRSRPSS